MIYKIENKKKSICGICNKDIIGPYKIRIDLDVRQRDYHADCVVKRLKELKVIK